MNKENGTWFMVMIHYKDVDSDFHAKIGTLDMKMRMKCFIIMKDQKKIS